jgi:hypothetical protein
MWKMILPSRRKPTSFNSYEATFNPHGLTSLLVYFKALLKVVLQAERPTPPLSQFKMTGRIPYHPGTKILKLGDSEVNTLCSPCLTLH